MADYIRHVGDEANAVRAIVYSWRFGTRSRSITSDIYSRASLIDGELMTEAQGRSQMTADFIRAGLPQAQYAEVVESFRVAIVHLVD